jgi:hypothetical protein
MSFLSEISYFFGGFGLLSLFSPILTPLFFILRLFGIHYYTIRNDEEKVRAVIKYLQKNTTSSEIIYQHGNSFPSGTFISPTCMGFYKYSGLRDSGTGEVQILTTKAMFAKMVESEKIASAFVSSKPAESLESTEFATEEVRPLQIYSRIGEYTNLYYSALRLDVQGLEPRGQQKEIVKDICQKYSETKRGVFFIHGISGAGKSTIGLLVAKQLKGTFCHTFNPTDPGDTLHLLLRDSDPCEESPTVIVLEEINTLIRKINEGLVQKHKNITTQINNKSTYNTFFDDLIMYKHVIIILTSNEDKPAIDALDPCYLRQGRIQGDYTMPVALL